MTTEEILALEPRLARYLSEFADCFGRSEPRSHLADYVRGQMSDMRRKSVEPLADFAGKAPRTLQEFLRTDEWDHAQMRDRLQQIVLRDHFDPQGIAILDDSGHRKKGKHTACVGRQYCGNAGKVDNCVVTVHLSYASFNAKFRAMLDSTPYLPLSWHEDRERCQRAGIPDDVVYRPKYGIALEQLDRARALGFDFAWHVADSWYGEKPKFIDGLDDRGRRFVLEVPHNLPGWSFDPGGQPPYPPRPASSIARHAKGMMRQPWARFQIKDTDKGPLLWEVKATPFWRRRDDGRIAGPYWLIWARNVLNPNEAKYLLSNASPGTPLEVILHVGFGRWPIERCLQDEKSHLGLSHFEVRNYQSLCRHLFITQVSHLFLAQETCRLRKKKSPDHDLPSPRSGRRTDRRLAAFRQEKAFAVEPTGRDPTTNATPQRLRQTVPRQNP